MNLPDTPSNLFLTSAMLVVELLVGSDLVGGEEGRLFGRERGRGDEIGTPREERLGNGEMGEIPVGVVVLLLVGRRID